MMPCSVGLGLLEAITDGTSLETTLGEADCNMDGAVLGVSVVGVLVGV
jgi:hypothetical protein